MSVELRLYRANRDEFSIRCLVGIIEMRPCIKHVHTPVIVSPALTVKRIDHRHRQGRSIGHCSVDHSTFTTALYVQKGKDHAKSKHHGTAPEIADHIGGGGRAVVQARVNLSAAGLVLINIYRTGVTI